LVNRTPPLGVLIQYYTLHNRVVPPPGPVPRLDKGGGRRWEPMLL